MIKVKSKQKIELNDGIYTNGKIRNHILYIDTAKFFNLKFKVETYNMDKVVVIVKNGEVYYRGAF